MKTKPQFNTDPWVTDQGERFPPGYWICVMHPNGKTVEWIRLPYGHTRVDTEGGFLRIRVYGEQGERLLIYPAHRVVTVLGVADPEQE